MKAKREFIEKALPPGFYRNHDEDIKMIGTSPIQSLFTNLKSDYKGTRHDSNLPRRRTVCSQGDDSNDKNEKVGLERSKL